MSNKFISRGKITILKNRKEKSAMKDELASELENLKNQKIVSEKTAQIYLSELRKKMKSAEDVTHQDKPE